MRKEATALLADDLVAESVPVSFPHSGCHCCLWCTIRGDQLKLPPGDPGQDEIQLQTTESILHDHGHCMADERKLNRAKLFNVVVNKPFFKDFPLSQVKMGYSQI